VGVIDEWRTGVYANERRRAPTRHSDEQRLAEFQKSFCALQGDSPFPWQEQLFAEFCRGELPSALDLPTGLGKTSVMTVWYLAFKADSPVPRRLAYVVDRRAVVD
jgi:CRISPR-associated endonuclease/helicase Cas3